MKHSGSESQKSHITNDQDPELKSTHSGSKSSVETESPEWNRRRFITGLASMAGAIALLDSRKALAKSDDGFDPGPLTIEKLGSFFVGGRSVVGSGVFDQTQPYTITAFPNNGETFSIDHLYVQFQIPPLARSLPIVMIHGAGQTGKTWESTPDGREGYQTTFVRRGFGAYVVDFPRRGRAGFPSFSGTLGTLTGSQVIPDYTTLYGQLTAFTLFRLGQTPFNYFANSQFQKAGLDQFFRQIIPDVTDDPDVISNAIAALLEEIGPAILVTHSQSGQFGWLTAMKSRNVKAVVAYEPSIFYFPTGEVPTGPSLYAGFPLPLGIPVTPADFQHLLQIPIQIVYGDNIPINPVPTFGLDLWRVVFAFAQFFVSTINNQGGNASLLPLPSIGLYGNTHFAFSDLNSLAVADAMSQFLRANSLDER